MTYKHAPEHEPVATALQRALAAADSDLDQFRRELMPSNVEIAIDALRMARDIFGKLCEAVLANDAERWQVVNEAHRLLCPAKKKPEARGRETATPAHTRGRPDTHPSSPWAPRPAVEKMAPPPRRRLEPNPGLGQTLDAQKPSGPTMPFQASSESPPPRVASKLEPHPALGGTVTMPGQSSGPTSAAVRLTVGDIEVPLEAYARATADLAAGRPDEESYRRCGVRDAEGWSHLHDAFEARFRLEPKLREQHAELVRRYQAGSKP